MPVRFQAPMASPSSSSRGTDTLDQSSDDKMLDGSSLDTWPVASPWTRTSKSSPASQLSEFSLAAPSPGFKNARDYETVKENCDWDASSVDSRLSSASSVASPSRSSTTSSTTPTRKSPSKSKKLQSAYHDEEQGVWRCRNCGGAYPDPSPSSRQRRNHKKSCEETRALALIKARQRSGGGDLALNGQGLKLKEASDNRQVLGERTGEYLPRNGHGDPGPEEPNNRLVTGHANWKQADNSEIDKGSVGARLELIKEAKFEAEGRAVMETESLNSGEEAIETNQRASLRGSGEESEDRAGHLATYSYDETLSLRAEESSEDVETPAQKDNPQSCRLRIAGVVARNIGAVWGHVAAIGVVTIICLLGSKI